MILIAACSLVPHTLRILFIGNSLLNVNDVPKTVAKMLESNGDSISYKSYFVGHLEDIPVGGEVEREVESGRYDFVILQSAMVSSSLSRTYSQTRGIALARSARARRARVLLYVEWPRRGIAETEYTMNVYRGIAREAKSEIVPVCYAWNSVLSKNPKLDLWQPDGNHATPLGSYVAACSVYFRIAGVASISKFIPVGVDPKLAALASAEAMRTETEFLKR